MFESTVIVEFLSYVATCRRDNTDEWMVGLSARINALLAQASDPTRVVYLMSNDALNLSDEGTAPHYLYVDELHWRGQEDLNQPGAVDSNPSG